MRIAAAVFFLCGVTAAWAVESDGNWTVLFDGSHLEQWEMGRESSWAIENGVIVLRREFDGQEHNADYLWTKESYGDFVLELEFLTLEGTNSGVFFRTSDVNDPVYTGIEVQIADSHGQQRTSRTGTAGALYDLVAPSKNAVKPPGEWNRLRLTAKGPQVVVELNGETIIDANLDQWTTARRNPDGTPNKFPTAIADFAREGRIGLQDHGRPVKYRNLRVRRLQE
jgi:hypothetical protein